MINSLSPTSAWYPQDYSDYALSILHGKKGRLLLDGSYWNHYGPLVGWQRYPMHQANFIIGLTQIWEKNHHDTIGKQALFESRNILNSYPHTENGLLKFPSTFSILGYRLAKNWCSSLTQSHAGSAFCRVDLIDHNEPWIEHAKSAMRFIIQSPELCTPDPLSGGFWYQEYPCRPPVPVLNGHMYATIGFLDLAVKTSSREFKVYFEKGLSSLLARIASFDADGLAYYDGTRKILAKPYYQKLHVKLLRFLAAISGEGKLDEFADRWEDGFRRKWGVQSRASYARKTLENGLAVNGLKFPLNYISYSLGDSGLSIVPRITTSKADAST